MCYCNLEDPHRCVTAKPVKLGSDRKSSLRVLKSDHGFQVITTLVIFPHSVYFSQFTDLGDNTLKIIVDFWKEQAIDCALGIWTAF